MQTASTVAASEVLAHLGRRRRSQRWLAEATKMHPATLRRRLAGQSSFTVDELEAIAAALDVRVTDLLADRVGAA